MYKYVVKWGQESMKEYLYIFCLFGFCYGDIFAMCDQRPSYHYKHNNYSFYSSRCYNNNNFQHYNDDYYRNEDEMDCTEYRAEPVACAPSAEYLPLPEKLLRESYRDNLNKECANINRIYTECKRKIKETRNITFQITLEYFKKVFEDNRLVYPGYSYRFHENNPVEEKKFYKLSVFGRKNIELYKKFSLLCVQFVRYSHLSRCMREYVDEIAHITETNQHVKERGAWPLAKKCDKPIKTDEPKTESDVSENELAKMLLPLLNNKETKTQEIRISPQAQSSSSSSCSLSEALIPLCERKTQESPKIICAYDRKKDLSLLRENTPVSLCRIKPKKLSQIICVYDKNSSSPVMSEEEEDYLSSMSGDKEYYSQPPKSDMSQFKSRYENLFDLFSDFL
jgi:hypothetical protein